MAISAESFQKHTFLTLIALPPLSSNMFLMVAMWKWCGFQILHVFHKQVSFFVHIPTWALRGYRAPPFLLGKSIVGSPWSTVERQDTNYFTSSDPHHDMLGGGCQVRVIIKNMMGRMENLRTLISGFLGLVILVRWALVTMFLSWSIQTGCRIHRTYVSLIGSGEGRHTTHLLKCVLLLSTSQTDWKQSSDVLSDISFDILSDKSSDIFSDILSDISSDILSDIFLTYLLTLFLTYPLTFFLTYLSTCFLTYLLTFFLTYQNQNLTSTASQKKPLCKLYIYLAPRSKSNIHDNFVPVNVIALSASDRPAKRQLSPKMQNACSSTHTHTPHASNRPAKRQLSPKMQKSLKCHNYISWRVQTMKSDARHCGACAGSA